jgi:hypothetical protein
MVGRSRIDSPSRHELGAVDVDEESNVANRNHHRLQANRLPSLPEAAPASGCSEETRAAAWRARLRGWLPQLGQCPGMSPDAAWAEVDELRVAERSTFESNIYVLPEEAAERGVMRCRGT